MKHLKLLFLSALMLIFCAGCGMMQPEHDVQITIPAHSTGEFYFSEEQVSPVFHTITLSCGKGLGDCSVVLRELDTPVPADAGHYLTGGVPAKVEARKDVWYRVGVSAVNETDRDKVVYVHLRGAEVRIS